MANSELNPHIESLTARHARLEARLADEQRRPLPDPVRLTQIKREKLRLKEEVSRSRTH
ncbi:MAG: YdcH family protein [Polymorphobacter sp.]|uniref:YdcH family protein n=1 Tax=Polymorphobacter sp. TaxID=1909290 RepID=UPI003A89BCAB